MKVLKINGKSISNKTLHKVIDSEAQKLNNEEQATIIVSSNGWEAAIKKKIKNVNIAIFGKGLVGGALIEQILKNTTFFKGYIKIQLTIFAVADSKKVLLEKEGVTSNWRNELTRCSTISSAQAVIDFAIEHQLTNLIAVDNTADPTFVQHYIPLIKAGFNLVSSNKIANTISYAFYKKLRIELDKNNKAYLYETNVGAGLPLINTLKLLHESGENITRIRGVFSGSLSFVFNRFSEENVAFSEVLKIAVESGFTEPDPREDLSGNDVARKLLILARELDLENEFDDIQIENLIPDSMQKLSVTDFLAKSNQLDAFFQELKITQKEDHVLRYVGDLKVDLQHRKETLDVRLVSVQKESSLGSLKGSDAIFEIYTESYGERPIVIQGAGAGAEVTARGVFGDILRLSKK